MNEAPRSSRRTRGKKRSRPPTSNLPESAVKQVRQMAEGIYNKTIEEMEFANIAKNYVPAGDAVKAAVVESTVNKMCKDRFSQLVKNGICESGIGALSRVRNRNDYNYTYKEKLRVDDNPDHEVALTDQGYSGRCWMFAALNYVRRKLITKYNLRGTFELSESYLFWADKIERANTLLTFVINEKQRNPQLDCNDDKLRAYYETMISDGGSWSYFVNLIQKYGIMPKSVWGETVNTYYSDDLNHHLIHYLTHRITRIVRSKKKFNKTKTTKLKNGVWIPEVIRLVTKFTGEPPTKFNWVYQDRHEEAQCVNNLTPLSFYKTIVEPEAELLSKVCLVHDPRGVIPIHRTAISGFNMIGDLPSVIHSVSMDDMIQATKTALQNQDGVWFAADVAQSNDLYIGVFDEEVHDFSGVLDERPELSAADAFAMTFNAPTHAMLFVGYNESDSDEDESDATEKDEDKTARDSSDRTDQFRVENSWGYIHWEDHGFHLMKRNWFERNVYMVVVDRAHVPAATWMAIKKHRSKPIALKYNDPFGCVAKSCAHCCKRDRPTKYSQKPSHRHHHR